MKWKKKKQKRREKNTTYRRDTDIDTNFHRVLEINQRKCHCWYTDSVNKHRFPHNVIQQNRYSIDIHIPPVR